MHGDAGIPQRVHLGDQGFGPLLDVEVVGHRPGGEKGGGIPGEELILRVGGGAAEDRGVGRALDGVLGEGVDKGHGVLVGLQVEGLRQVGEGLVHNHDDVYRLGAVRPRAHRGHAGGVHAAGNPAERLLRVPVRLAHAAVPQADREVEHEAVAPGGPHGRLHPDSGEEGGAEEDRQKGGTRQPRRKRGAEPGPGAALLPGQGQQHQQKNCQHQAGEHLGPVEIIAVVGGHVGRGAQGQQVPGKDGAAPEVDDIVVGHAQHPEEGGRNAAAQVPPPAYQPDEKGRQIVKRQIQTHLEGG